MRLFVALAPPDSAVEELRSGTSALRRLAPELRWTRPEHWHLTLAFLGEVDSDVVDPLSGGLAQVAARHPPLSVSFGGGGRFGHRVLWTRVHGDLDGLGRLAGSVRATARRSALPIDERPYRPHLTLARATGATDLAPLVERLASYVGRPWVATRLYLVHSRLGAGTDGYARYETAADWPLDGSNRPVPTWANSSGT